jgi:LysM repeat protein
MRNFTALSEFLFDQIIKKRSKSRTTVRLAAVGIGVAAIAVGVVHTITVRPGDSLSAIASKACGNASDWTGIYQQNSVVVGSNPNLIYPGERLTFKCNAATIETALASPQDPPADPPASSSGTSAVIYHGSGNSSFQACVIARESGGDPQITNSSGHYGLYQFSASTWAEYGGNPADFGDASISEQNQVFDNAMAAGGEYNWSPYDGC